MNTNIKVQTYTNVPNYYFNLINVVDNFTTYEYTVLTYLQKYANTKFKPNNQLIADDLKISKRKVQSVLKSLIDLNIVAKVKLHASNSNLLHINHFNVWDIPNKVMLFTNEFNIHRDSFSTIQQLFTKELNYTLSAEEETMIKNYIQNISTNVNVEAEVVEVFEEITNNTAVTEETIIEETVIETPAEPIIEETVIETPTETIIKEVTTDAPSDETIDEIMDSIDFDNVVDEIVDNSPEVEIPAPTQENDIEEEFIDTDYLVERVIKMVEDNTTDKIYNELTTKEEKIINVYIQNFDFNDSELNNKSFYFVNDLLSGELNKIGDQYIRNVCQDFKKMFEMLKLVNKSNMKNLNYV